MSEPSLPALEAERNRLHAQLRARPGETGPPAARRGPYFGHPEADLALVDYFQPVPADVFAAYREIAPIDPGFADRRELWRLAAYLAVIAVDGHPPFGRRYLNRVATTVLAYG